MSMHIFRGVFRVAVAGVILATMTISPVFAEDAKTPLTELDAATTALMKGLDDNQLRQLGSIQNGHGIIRAVEDVQKSIARAVTSCSKENPDMKDGMSTRFEAWKDSVRPVMKDARKRLDKMILLQSFAQPSEVRAYLKKFDAAVIFRNQGIKAVPVKEKSACAALQKSMDETQGNMAKMLTEALGLDSDIQTKE